MLLRMMISSSFANTGATIDGGEGSQEAAALGRHPYEPNFLREQGHVDEEFRSVKPRFPWAKRFIQTVICGNRCERSRQSVWFCR